MPSRKISVTLSEPQKVPAPVADVEQALLAIRNDLQQG
jgi:hypothetical protein